MVDMYFISPGFVHALFKIFIVVGFTKRMDSHPHFVFKFDLTYNYYDFQIYKNLDF
jgi:hypothetical protein